MLTDCVVVEGWFIEIFASARVVPLPLIWELGGASMGGPDLLARVAP